MLKRSPPASRRISTRSTRTAAENGVPPKLKRTVPRVPCSTGCEASRRTPLKLMSSRRTGTGNAKTESSVSVIADRGTRRRSMRGSSCIINQFAKKSPTKGSHLSAEMKLVIYREDYFSLLLARQNDICRYKGRLFTHLPEILRKILGAGEGACLAQVRQRRSRVRSDARRLPERRSM
jgi:hypothetical protein